jgi:hypothetical protein
MRQQRQGDVPVPARPAARLVFVQAALALGHFMYYGYYGNDLTVEGPTGSGGE